MVVLFQHGDRWVDRMQHSDCWTQYWFSRVSQVVDRRTRSQGGRLCLNFARGYMRYHRLSSDSKRSRRRGKWPCQALDLEGSFLIEPGKCLQDSLRTFSLPAVIINAHLCRPITLFSISSGSQLINHITLFDSPSKPSAFIQTFSWLKTYTVPESYAHYPLFPVVLQHYLSSLAARLWLPLEKQAGQ